MDYNELFTEFERDCEEENVCNAFSCITLGELKDLNYLLDRVLIFCENCDEEEVEGMECGEHILKLGKLADKLFFRDLQKDK